MRIRLYTAVTKTKPEVSAFSEIVAHDVRKEFNVI